MEREESGTLRLWDTVVRVRMKRSGRWRRRKDRGRKEVVFAAEWSRVLGLRGKLQTCLWPEGESGPPQQW